MSSKIQGLFQRELVEGLDRNLMQVEAHVESRLAKLIAAASRKQFDGMVFVEAFVLFTAARSALAYRANQPMEKILSQANASITQKVRPVQTTIDAAYVKLRAPMRKSISPDALMAVAAKVHEKRKPKGSGLPKGPKKMPPRRHR